MIQSIFSFLSPFLRYWIGGTVANAIVDPFLAVALTLMYFHLRESPATAVPGAPEPAPTDPTADAPTDAPTDPTADA